MTQKKIASIIIPTFNRAHFLKKAIDSALDQTVPCEVIVVDHGSSDQTPDVAKAYGDKIVYIRREKDLGVHFSWLEGVMSASLDWIHFNFDDDWLDPACIESCLKLMQPNVGVVFSQAMIMDENNKSIKNEFSNLFSTGIHKRRKLENYLLRSGTLISPGCCLLRKHDLLNWLFIGSVPGAKHHYKGVGPDLLFSLGALFNYPKFGFLNEPLVFFRAHSQSITIDSRKDKEKRKKIKSAYNDAKKFYLMLKISRMTGIQNGIFWFYNHVLLLPFRILQKIGVQR